MLLSRVGPALGATLLVTFVAAPLAQARVINGTPGPDHLVGTAHGDRIRGLGGADWVSARSGRDVVFGGVGHDELHGRGGRDVVFGDRGRDLVLGGDGNDALIGGFGDDVVEGGKGSDILGNPAPNFGFQGNDTLVGGPGIDALLEDGNGNDVLRGGPNKTSNGFFSKEFLSPAGGADKVFGGPGPDIVALTNDGRRDVIDCGSGHDVVGYSKKIDRKDVISNCEKIRDHENRSHAVPDGQPLLTRTYIGGRHTHHSTATMAARD
jgi:Ca2+-binding RTX toxin-like protein